MHSPRQSQKEGYDFGPWTLDSILERLTASEACINVVPPFDAVAFAELPAEQHDASVA